MKVFLSHSSRDKDLARRLAVDLSMSGVSVWFDEWQILFGHSITQQVSAGLTDADFVVLMLSEHAVASGWVQKEWMSRIGLEAETRGVQILTVLGSDCELPVLLRDKKYADIRTNYNGGLRELIASLRAHAAVGRPVSIGARIASGRIIFERTTPPVPVLSGLINTIESGCFERQGDGLRVHVTIVSAYRATEEFGAATGLNRVTLDSDDFSVSIDKARPTCFEGSRSFRVAKGTVITNPMTGEEALAPIDITGQSRVRVLVTATDGVISGSFEQSLSMDGMRSMVTYGTLRALIAL